MKLYIYYFSVSLLQCFPPRNFVPDMKLSQSEFSLASPSKLVGPRFILTLRFILSGVSEIFFYQTIGKHRQLCVQKQFNFLLSNFNLYKWALNRLPIHLGLTITFPQDSFYHVSSHQVRSPWRLIPSETQSVFIFGHCVNWLSIPVRVYSGGDSSVWTFQKFLWFLLPMI